MEIVAKFFTGILGKLVGKITHQKKWHFWAFLTLCIFWCGIFYSTENYYNLVPIWIFFGTIFCVVFILYGVGALISSIIMLLLSDEFTFFKEDDNTMFEGIVINAFSYNGIVLGVAYYQVFHNKIDIVSLRWIIEFSGLIGLGALILVFVIMIIKAWKMGLFENKNPNDDIGNHEANKG